MPPAEVAGQLRRRQRLLEHAGERHLQRGLVQHQMPTVLVSAERTGQPRHRRLVRPAGQAGVCDLGLQAVAVGAAVRMLVVQGQLVHVAVQLAQAHRQRQVFPDQQPGRDIVQAQAVEVGVHDDALGFDPAGLVVQAAAHRRPGAARAAQRQLADLGAPSVRLGHRAGFQVHRADPRQHLLAMHGGNPDRLGLHAERGHLARLEAAAQMQAGALQHQTHAGLERVLQPRPAADSADRKGPGALPGVGLVKLAVQDAVELGVAGQVRRRRQAHAQGVVLVAVVQLGEADGEYLRRAAELVGTQRQPAVVDTDAAEALGAAQRLPLVPAAGAEAAQAEVAQGVDVGGQVQAVELGHARRPIGAHQAVQFEAQAQAAEARQRLAIFAEHGEVAQIQGGPEVVPGQGDAADLHRMAQGLPHPPLQLAAVARHGGDRQAEQQAQRGAQHHQPGGEAQAPGPPPAAAALHYASPFGNAGFQFPVAGFQWPCKLDP